MPPMVLVHRKGFQNISSFLKTWQPDTCPHPPQSSSSASPVRCSLGGCDHPPGTWVHPEEPPPEDAMPPAGHEETGPVKGDEVSGGPESREGWREAVRSCGLGETWPWWGCAGKGGIPAVSWMAGPMSQKSFGPEKTRQGWEQNTVATDIYIM